ncbi:DUF3493 domain-containing protein [Synechococcus sp. H70.1]|uniref:DUF3493 domain-containing protein n=1 Tax=Synechococcus sp. H70.1 TaxID=2964527 RepID=UPI0039C67120
MAESDPKSSPKASLPQDPTAERARLLAEVTAPYRSLRRFVYLAVGFSAGVGAFVFFFRALAGRDLETTLPSLALQLGILAGALGLNRLENRSQQKLVRQMRQRLSSQKESPPPPKGDPLYQRRDS